MIGRRRRTWVEKARRRPGPGLGLAVLAIALAGVYMAFAKEIPFTSRGYELHAVFANATTLRPNSPVRIAGVNVGKVVSVEPRGNAAEATFTVSDEGLPIHSDATIEIRPRLFLEGNFFLDLHPGSPSAPELGSGDTIPITDTSRAVQLDEVLTALQSPERRNLSRLVRAFGTTLAHEPSTAEDRTQAPAVQGESAAQALHDSFAYGARAGRGTAITAQALLGAAPHDLSGLIASQSRVFGALLSREAALRDLISGFDATTGALAAQSRNLGATIHELAPTLEEGRSSLRRLDGVLPELRRWAIEVEPGLRELPATIRAGTPWLRQAQPLLGPAELGGDTRLLAAAAPSLGRTAVVARELFPQFGLTARCVANVLVPAGNEVIHDPFATGQPDYRDTLYGIVNFVGAGQSFDGNGQLLRVQAGGGSQLVRSDNPNGGFQNDSLWGLSAASPQGTQPVVSGTRPAYRPDVPCPSNPVPDLNGAAGAAGPPSPRAYP